MCALSKGCCIVDEACNKRKRGSYAVHTRLLSWGGLWCTCTHIYSNKLHPVTSALFSVSMQKDKKATWGQQYLYSSLERYMHQLQPWVSCMSAWPATLLHLLIGCASQVALFYFILRLPEMALEWWYTTCSTNVWCYSVGLWQTGESYTMWMTTDVW